MGLRLPDGLRITSTVCLGGLRSSAQMISYELPLSLAITAPLLTRRDAEPARNRARRKPAIHFGFLPRWTIFNGPFPQMFSFIIFLIAAFAETNRVPFDLPEAENELVAGFHTEYSSMQFASFFMAEYANMITISSMTTTLFLGGWQPLFPASLGSNLVPGILFFAGRRLRMYSRPEPAAQARPPHAARLGDRVLLIAVLLLVPAVQRF